MNNATIKTKCGAYLSDACLSFPFPFYTHGKGNENIREQEQNLFKGSAQLCCGVAAGVVLGPLWDPEPGCITFPGGF